MATTETETADLFDSIAHRDADAFEVLRRDNEDHAPEVIAKSPAEALQSIKDRANALSQEQLDIEDTMPDVAARMANQDQADFAQLGAAERVEASQIIADHFRNRNYSAEFARSNPEAAEDIVREVSAYRDPAMISEADLDEALVRKQAQKIAQAASQQARMTEDTLRANPGSTDEAIIAAKEDRKAAESREMALAGLTREQEPAITPPQPAEPAVTVKPANTRPLSPSAEKRQIQNELKALHAEALPGYSPQDSWEHYKALAKAEGLTASIARGAPGEQNPPYIISYQDANGQALPITTELYINGKAATQLNGDRVPGTGLTTDTEWQRAAFAEAIKQHQLALRQTRLDDINRETAQIQATPEFRRMETLRQSEFDQARQALNANAALAMNAKLVQDTTGQTNVAIQQGDDTRTFFKTPSLSAANSVLASLRDNIKDKLFSKVDFAVLPKLQARKNQANGETVYELEQQPANQIRDGAAPKLGEDGTLAVGKEFDGKRVLKASELPAKFHKKFIVSDEVPGKFYFPDTKKLAFSDHGGKLATDQNKPEVVRSMIDLAKEKNWSSITLSGTDEFKREAWLQASLEGMEVKGYKPKPEDIALLDQAREKQMSNRVYQAPGNSQPMPAPPQNEISGNPQPAPGTPAVEASQPQIQSQRITLSIPSGSQVDPELLRTIETAITRPIAANSEAGKIKIPDDYKPSPDAMAVGEKLRAYGAPEDKTRLAMYGVDLSRAMTQQLGLPAFQARVFDPAAQPQAPGKIASVAVEKTTLAPVIDITQPSKKIQR